MESSTPISSIMNHSDHKRNLTSNLSNEWGTETFEKFETKHSNEYLSKTYWHKWRTKPSSSDYSWNDEDLFKSKIKLLQESLELAEKRYSDADVEIIKLKKDIDLLRFENNNLKVSLIFKN